MCTSCSACQPQECSRFSLPKCSHCSSGYDDPGRQLITHLVIKQARSRKSPCRPPTRRRRGPLPAKSYPHIETPNFLPSANGPASRFCQISKVDNLHAALWGRFSDYNSTWVKHSSSTAPSLEKLKALVRLFLGVASGIAPRWAERIRIRFCPRTRLKIPSAALALRKCFSLTLSCSRISTKRRVIGSTGAGDTAVNRHSSLQANPPEDHLNLPRACLTSPIRNEAFGSLVEMEQASLSSCSTNSSAFHSLSIRFANLTATGTQTDFKIDSEENTRRACPLGSVISKPLQPYCLRGVLAGDAVIEHLDGMNRYRAGLHVPGNVLVACKRRQLTRSAETTRCRLSHWRRPGGSRSCRNDGSKCAPSCMTCLYWKQDAGRMTCNLELRPCREP